MKKIIFPMLALALIAVCFPGNVNAQSSEQDLDPVELMKQFVGTWVEETDKDRAYVLDVIPYGKGYEQILNRQVKGETFPSVKGLTRVDSSEVQTIYLWTSGNMAADFGKFETDNKIVFERYGRNLTHVRAILEWHLVNPDKIKWIYKNRGNKETWDDAVVNELIYTRVKK